MFLLTDEALPVCLLLFVRRKEKTLFSKYKNLKGRPWQWHLVDVWNDSSLYDASMLVPLPTLNIFTQYLDSHCQTSHLGKIKDNNSCSFFFFFCSINPVALMFFSLVPQVDVSMAASLPQKPGMPGIPSQQQQQPLLPSAVPPGPGQQSMPPQGALREISPVFLCRIGQETVQDIVTRTMEIFQITRATQVSTMSVALNKTWANYGPGNWYIFSAIKKENVFMPWLFFSSLTVWLRARQCTRIASESSRSICGSSPCSSESCGCCTSAAWRWPPTCRKDQQRSGLMLRAT